MKIEFLEEYKTTVDGWLSFRAIIDGRRVTNRISEEALQDYFESDGTTRGDETSFKRHRSRIRVIAERLILSGQTNEFGGADLTTEAVEKFGEEMLS